MADEEDAPKSRPTVEWVSIVLMACGAIAGAIWVGIKLVTDVKTVIREGFDFPDLSGLKDLTAMDLLGIGALCALGIGFYFLPGPEPEQPQEDPGKALRDRAQSVSKSFEIAARSFEEATGLMAGLQRELDAQQAAREALVKQAEEQQDLLAINKEDAERIRRILLGESRRNARQDRRFQWGIFTLGVAVSIPIGALINLVF